MIAFPYEFIISWSDPRALPSKVPVFAHFNILLQIWSLLQVWAKLIRQLPCLTHAAWCRLIHCIKYNRSCGTNSSTMARKSDRTIQMVACGRLEMSADEKPRQDWILAVWCCRQACLLNSRVHALNHCVNATFPHGKHVRFFKGWEFFVINTQIVDSCCVAAKEYSSWYVEEGYKFSSTFYKKSCFSIIVVTVTQCKIMLRYNGWPSHSISVTSSLPSAILVCNICERRGNHKPPCGRCKKMPQHVN